MIVTKVSPKYGEVEILIDEKDAYLLGSGGYVWGSERHNSLYVIVTQDGQQKRLHRAIMNAQPGEVVDHINGNALDNRRCNLRITTQAGNNKNARKRKDAQTSKYKGVHYSSREKKWKAQIQKDGIKYNLGTYETEIEAAKAYDNAAIDLFKEYAILNLAEAK
jgi:hypothetical protein